tara:strand:- start:519 stop:704 length:186 start_codon:yes stop_codon:yes gene_type:complete
MGMNHLMIKAEEWKKQALVMQEENQLLRHDVKELQEQVYTLYKRIAELTNDNMERKTPNRH